ncbi:putative CCR4-associated factor 1 7 [Cinnamomum micranthum f. kanehirae]|uniref:poly(A)-specific ribonuclease n=1 Tax=Cinnamomum micranthum f. kanehirae TaxID=337451 RepID=A0A3S4PJ11_9MAGN|nr:putative CCR4-associated factor 1 7 [Cinnamomum micranthum f. kanehirae]
MRLIEIREVWNDNLEAEFGLIRDIVDHFPILTMDTVFPGIPYRPAGNPKNASGNNYQILKANVDASKLIQLGLTFFDEHGNLPICGTDGKHCSWQFNFREFDVSKDAFLTDSIELLSQNGIDFKKNSQHGIDDSLFGELVMSSGIVLNEDVKWVAFHGGYDFGFLLKLLTGKSCLPDTEVEFLQLIKVFFKNVYDVKHMMKYCKGLHGGLNKVAELLDVKRVGVYQQAGSNSLLTYGIFSKLKELFFNGSTEKYAGVLFGLGGDNDKVKTLVTECEGGKLVNHCPKQGYSARFQQISNYRVAKLRSISEEENPCNEEEEEEEKDSNEEEDPCKEEEEEEDGPCKEKEKEEEDPCKEEEEEENPCKEEEDPYNEEEEDDLQITKRRRRRSTAPSPDFLPSSFLLVAGEGESPPDAAPCQSPESGKKANGRWLSCF